MTVMAEWWAGGQFETRYYTPYRKKVEASLALRQQHQAPSYVDLQAAPPLEPRRRHHRSRGQLTGL